MFVFSNLEWSIPALDTPQWHQQFPRSHHTQCPTHGSCRSLLCLHLECFLLPVAAEQLYMGLYNRTEMYRNQTFILLLLSSTWPSISVHYRIPSQPTPASAEWMQLWERIGLLGHPSSWLEVEVHWTSSRKIGPLPIPKWALLYALPPV